MQLPFYSASTPPKEVARSLARHALSATNERQRRVYMELARLHMDLAILDAQGLPAPTDSQPAGHP
ncbi:hypothetical protein ACFU51_28405 [Streptomyces sp. NPDC057430]|uniref:hypothetical protein n=1 Tax=Streptomyces sp. NPDC057430 TaxID=3346131 RepID=UPI00369FC1ED